MQKRLSSEKMTLRHSAGYANFVAEMPIEDALVGVGA
jgi:hypothetical protein